MSTPFRSLENRPGIEFDEEDRRRIYAEDWYQLITAINHLEISLDLEAIFSDRGFIANYDMHDRTKIVFLVGGGSEIAGFKNPESEPTITLVNNSFNDCHIVHLSGDTSADSQIYCPGAVDYWFPHGTGVDLVYNTSEQKWFLYT